MLPSYSHHNNSENKQKNRLFKLKYAKRVMRAYFKKYKVCGDIYTLCGDSLWLELELAEYARDLMLGVHDSYCNICYFNNNPIEWDDLETYEIEYLNPIKKLAKNHNISFGKYLNKFTPKYIDKDSDATLIDLDTCQWFLSPISDMLIDFSGREYPTPCIMLNTLINGRLGHNIVNFPIGLDRNSIKDPQAIQKWIHSNTKYRVDAVNTYRNIGSHATMATFILKCVNKVPENEKDEVRKLIVIDEEGLHLI